MRKIDWSHLDAHLLQLLLAVLDTGSITAAAARLGVTQSAVSHLLDKLRAITGDPLFVKRGRGIAPTAHAHSLAAPARTLLQQMQQFAHRPAFDPTQWQAALVVAANDFQRDLLLPPLAARLRAQAPGVTLRVVPSGVPSLQLLRTDACHLAISPRPPDGTDILQKRLFDDPYRVFFDPAVRQAPATKAAYLAADHASVAYEAHRGLEIDQLLQARGTLRRFAVLVPGFSALPAFVRGTPLLVTAPRLLGHTTLAGLAHAALPIPCPAMPMFMVWHARYQHDPAQRWLREQLEAVVAPALACPPV